MQGTMIREVLLPKPSGDLVTIPTHAVHCSVLRQEQLRVGGMPHTAVPREHAGLLQKAPVSGRPLPMDNTQLGLHGGT